MPGITEPRSGEIQQIIGFHDGNLKGFRTLEDGNLLIWCLTTQGVEYTIQFPELESLLVDHFTGSNILNSMLLHEARKSPRDLFAKVTHLDSDQFKTLLEKRIEDFTKTNRTLLEIGTSDGCVFLAIFQGSANAIKIERVVK